MGVYYFIFHNFPRLFFLLFVFDQERGHLGFVALALGSFIFSALVWKDLPVEYEFTGEEIIERRRGHIRNRMHISDIIETKVKVSPHQLVLKTVDSKMTVHILPSLAEVIQKKGAEEMANKSKAEQQNYEKVLQAMKTHVKRVNLIGVILMILFVFGLIIVFGWLRQKHYFAL